MKRVNGRNRNGGLIAISAITGISTDSAAVYIRKLSFYEDTLKQRIRNVEVHEMERTLSDHGWQLTETVTPYDGQTIASYEGEVKETGGLHVAMTKRVRSRVYHWIVLEKFGDGVKLVDAMHRNPTAIPLTYSNHRIIRAYYVASCESSVQHESVERRRWTEEEDALIREAADWNAYSGITEDRRYVRRLHDVAQSINRTYASVRVRASRIGALSYSVKRQVRIDE